LVGPRWKEADGIVNGITFANRLEMPGLHDFSNKAGLILRYGPAKAIKCQAEISVSLTVSTPPDRAETPSTQGSSLGLTIEWE
jgi:hypothetical protein